MKDHIILTPTVQRARYEWEKFIKMYHDAQIIESVRPFPTLDILLINGMRLKFVGETEGQRAVRGRRATLVSIDEFDLNDILKEDSNESV